jgi:hypothetical protein
MSLSLISGALGIAGTLFSAWWFWYRRKAAPTTQEQLQDEQTRYSNLRAQLAAAEARGDYVRAEHILSELRISHGWTPDGKPNS